MLHTGLLVEGIDIADDVVVVILWRGMLHLGQYYQSQAGWGGCVNGSTGLSALLCRADAVARARYKQRPAQKGRSKNDYVNQPVIDVPASVGRSWYVRRPTCSLGLRYN